MRSVTERRGGAAGQSGEGKPRRWGKNALLVPINIILVLAMVLLAVLYSQTNQRQKNLMRRDVFCNTIESLKKVSENYLYTEKGYVDDWAAYISAHHMTAEEAIDFIRETNTHEDRVAHLVDMDDLSARSTVVGSRDNNWWVHCYEEQAKLATDASSNFLDKMERMFNADKDEVLVLGKYRVGEIQRTVISVGARVTIRQSDGTDKDMLLLRLIPAEYLQRSWVFPTEFPTAEVSLISSDGGYIVQSASMRSKNFLEFIRGYNFQDGYNKMYELAERLETTDSGLLEYKNSSGEDCYFYYSKLDQDDSMCVLGYIPVAQIETAVTDWSVVMLICGMLFLLVLFDGWHILSINRELRKTAKIAEQANEAKTQFLSSMSHDIRTPMNAVLGMTEIAKHHLKEPDYVKDCLDKVSVSGNHLLTLINDILDISKVESGKMTLSPAAFSLRGAAEEMSAMIRQSAEEKGLTYTMTVHDVTRDVVVGDPLRIRQVLINLLTNAVKYTDPGGHVGFDVCEQPSASDGKVELRFTVSDDGMGMSEQFQQTMYASFSRATDSRINTIQGSGLGLAIAHQMVELMDGTIECESALGAGTTFTVTLLLPVADELPQEDSENRDAERGKDGEFAGMRVLVAEDNDMNWEIVHTLMDEYQIISERAENGERCLARLNDTSAPRCDLVLMDVQMPVMDGKTATRCLRASKDPYVRSIPVVAMTADAFAEDIYACLESGMDAHVSKPLEMKQVLRCLRKAKNGTLHRKEEM